MYTLHNAYLVFPSSDLAEVPGFFEADFRPAKNPVGFVTRLIALVFAGARSPAVVLAVTFVSTFDDGFAGLTGVIRLDPFTFDPEFFFPSSDCSRLIPLWSPGSFETTPFGCWPSVDFAVVFCLETFAALSRIFCA